ncbi:MAG: hypothetical protein CM15mV36_1180 [Caudoviricetes sp.]|nr:MAG: hypothetical protein CM15mV36_1180 [Caudoviricetes sp.]
MKKFSAFLSEAERSFAAKAAEKLKLQHIGYGRYADKNGNVTHMSQNGELVKITKDNDPGPQQSAGGEETADGEGAVDQGAISITFGRFNPPTIGHEKLLDKVAREAKASGGAYRIYPSRTEDPKKNPSMQVLKSNICVKRILITLIRSLITLTCVLFLMFLGTR